MARTLYVTDLDGTLLNAQGLLSERAAASLAGLAARGVLVTCATARSWTSTSRVIGPVLSQPAVVHNGAATVDPRTGRFLDCHYLAPDVVDTVIDACASAGVTPLIHAIYDNHELTAWLDERTSETIANYWADRAGDPRNSPRSSFAELPRTGVLGAAILASPEMIEKAATALEQRLDGAGSVMVRQDTYRSGTGWLEVTATAASKGAGVLAIAERTGAERIVVFGDDVNDESMFEIADESYAVTDAIETLRARADGVIGSNTDDAVVRWLETYGE